MHISRCVESLFKRSAVAALVSIAVICGAGAADALPVYYPADASPCPPFIPGCVNPPPNTPTYQGGGQIVGAIFTAQTAQTFNSLGFIDLNNTTPQSGLPDGLLASYEVGIWNATTQTLLATTLVTPASPLVFDGGVMFHYAPIPAVTIPAGQQFVVAALLPVTPLDPWRINDIHVNTPGITGPGTGRFTTYTPGSYPYPNQIPTDPLGSNVWSIANASSTIVPEPSTGLLLASALLGLAGWRRART
jgi:PEP-CTERM motif-containing protein